MRTRTYAMTSQLIGRNAQAAVVVDDDLKAVVWADVRTHSM
jgi:hypothetical protein